ncbi:MAG: hypothetical protein IPP32_14240 [Bacteroidetes bacterium]|nr:hypothetical protein [Bacteroidota bacterium]
MKQLLGIFLLSLIGCSSENTQTNIPRTKLKNDLAENLVKQKDSIRFDQFIFGKFCGECSGICAPIYKLSTIGNASTLWVDLTNDYFRKGSNLKYSTNASSADNISIAYNLMWNLPKEFVEYTSTDSTYGCPDCTDGCGIYIEFRRSLIESKPKRFLIDLHRHEGISSEIYKYGQTVNTAINKLRN